MKQKTKHARRLVRLWFNALHAGDREKMKAIQAEQKPIYSNSNLLHAAMRLEHYKLSDRKTKPADLKRRLELKKWVDSWG